MTAGVCSRCGNVEASAVFGPCATCCAELRSNASVRAGERAAVLWMASFSGRGTEGDPQ